MQTSIMHNKTTVRYSFLQQQMYYQSILKSSVVLVSPMQQQHWFFQCQTYAYKIYNTVCLGENVPVSNAQIVSLVMRWMFQQMIRLMGINNNLSSYEPNHLYIVHVQYSFNTLPISFESKRIKFAIGLCVTLDHVAILTCMMAIISHLSKQQLPFIE